MKTKSGSFARNKSAGTWSLSENFTASIIVTRRVNFRTKFSWSASMFHLRHTICIPLRLILTVLDAWGLLLISKWSIVEINTIRVALLNVFLCNLVIRISAHLLLKHSLMFRWMLVRRRRIQIVFVIYIKRNLSSYLVHPETSITHLLYK